MNNFEFCILISAIFAQKAISEEKANTVSWIWLISALLGIFLNWIIK